MVDDLSQIPMDGGMAIDNEGELVIRCQIGGDDDLALFAGELQTRPVYVKRFSHEFYNIGIQEFQTLIKSDKYENINRVHGKKEKDGYCYIAMERYDCSLSELIMENKLPRLYSPSLKGFPHPDLLKLMRGIVNGLAKVHKSRIIHMDLRPSNVLIVGLDDEEELCAKLSGMESNNFLENDNSSVESDRSEGDIPDLQTLVWKPVEQLKHWYQKRQTDVFSLGCLLFCCLTQGKHPFGDEKECYINVIDNHIDYLWILKPNYEAMDLIPQLLKQNLRDRPSASNILLHPLFWNPERRLSFLKDASDCVETNSFLVQLLENQAKKVFPRSGWQNSLCKSFLIHMLGKRKYNTKKLQDLLRIVRNTTSHFYELYIGNGPFARLLNILGIVNES